MNTLSVNYITCSLHFGEQRSYSIEVPTGYIVSARTRETAKNEFKKKLNSLKKETVSYMINIKFNFASINKKR